MTHAHHDSYSKTVFGFWVYLVTDFMMFATIFAAYAVLSKSTYGQPSGRELFSLCTSSMQAALLLFVAMSAALAHVFAKKENIRGMFISYGAVVVLGILFAGMQWREFAHCIAVGAGWRESAYLSAYFTLVGTHFLHVIVALLWTGVVLAPVFKYGLTDVALRRISCLSLFWMFLNVVWIFIYSFVYLLGVI